MLHYGNASRHPNCIQKVFQLSQRATGRRLDHSRLCRSWATLHNNKYPRLYEKRPRKRRVDPSSKHRERVCSIFLYPTDTLSVSYKQCKAEPAVLLFIHIPGHSHATRTLGDSGFYSGVWCHFYNNFHLPMHPNTVLLATICPRH